MKKRMCHWTSVIFVILLLTACGERQPVGNVAGDPANDSAEVSDTSAEVLTEAESEASRETSEPGSGMDREIYWTMPIEDYEISLQAGATEETLELLFQKDGESKVLRTFESWEYQIFRDITAEAFEDILGHDGFCIYQRCPLGTESYYYTVGYYAIEYRNTDAQRKEAELVPVAYRWGARDDGFWIKDVDGDGIDEMICNVQWMADGAMDVYIYHFDGEKVLRGAGTDLLEEEFDNHGIGAIGAEYLPQQDKVRIWYWKDELEDFAEKEFEIDLEKLEMTEYIG